MRARLPLLRASAVLLLGAAVGAQTFVVDAANGSGTDFTTIAAAVAFVPDGAVLLVRPGVYHDFAIDAKGLAVLGEPGAVVVRNSFSPTVVVTNLAPTQTVRLHGLVLAGAPSFPVLLPAAVQCTDNLGDVVLQACRGVDVPGYAGGAFLSAARCRSVRLLECEFRPGYLGLSNPGAVSASASSVYCTATTLVPPNDSAFAGLHLSQGASGELADCTVFGGGVAPAGAAIAFAGNGSARLLGSTHLITDHAAGMDAPAVTGPGIVVLDPTVQLGAFVPPIGPSVSATLRSMPVVAAHTEARGGLAHGSLVVPPGGVGGLFAGSTIAAIAFPPLADPVFLDGSTAVAMAHGVAGIPVTASYVVPGAATVLGLQVGWQGWSYDPAAGFQGSNAVFTVHW